MFDPGSLDPDQGGPTTFGRRLSIPGYLQTIRRFALIFRAARGPCILIRPFGFGLACLDSPEVICIRRPAEWIMQNPNRDSIRSVSLYASISLPSSLFLFVFFVVRSCWPRTEHLGTNSRKHESVSPCVKSGRACLFFSTRERTLIYPRSLLFCVALYNCIFWTFGFCCFTQTLDHGVQIGRLYRHLQPFGT